MKRPLPQSHCQRSFPRNRVTVHLSVHEARLLVFAADIVRKGRKVTARNATTLNTLAEYLTARTAAGGR